MLLGLVGFLKVVGSFIIELLGSLCFVLGGYWKCEGCVLVYGVWGGWLVVIVDRGFDVVGVRFVMVGMVIMLGGLGVDMVEVRGFRGDFEFRL